MVVGCTVEVSMSRHRAKIQIPVEVLEREVQRQRLIKLFESNEPIWKDEDHPELEKGADEWVRQMRRESETRLLQLDID